MGKELPGGRRRQAGRIDYWIEPNSSLPSPPPPDRPATARTLARKRTSMYLPLIFLLDAATILVTADLPSGTTSFCAEQGWQQVWADEFSGPTLNESAWSIDLNGGDSRVRNSQGTRDNVYIEDGNLVLRSQRQKSGKYVQTDPLV
jgi:hypothetical protein